MTGIIPAAGRGTRMASVTGGQPKELLKLGRRTVLDRIIDEAKGAGAERVIVVTSPDKPEIAEHLSGADVEIAYQSQMRGIADAIAASLVDDDIIVLLGDVVYEGGAPTSRMAELLNKGLDGAVAVEAVDESRVSLYGIVEINEYSGGIQRILEKPLPSETASRWAVAARYAFTRSWVAQLHEFVNQPETQMQSAEIGITQFLMFAIRSGADLKAVALQPGQHRVDCGSPEEYAAARRLMWD